MPKKLHPTEQRAASRREGLLSLLSGAVAEPVAGLAGLYGLVTGGLNKGADNIEATRNALTYQPRDPSSLQALGRAVAPITDRIEAGKRWMGDGVLAKTGSPALATAAHIAPDVLATLLGARGAGIKGPSMTQMAERSAGPMMGSPVSQIGAINAWHGSPHDFDRFSMANIGTGEGAQAYGHGLYFAGNKEVAGQYQRALSGRTQIGAPRASDPAYVSAARSFAEARVSPEETLAGLKQAYPDAAEQDLVMAMHEGNPGRLYNVELAPDETDLLDWDAPLSQQPEKVRAALEANAPHYIRQGDPTGKEIYEALARGKANNSGSESAKASKWISEYGIPGIRYLDGGSRAAGDGSRNYVMFDDSLVKIRGKE